MVDVTLTLKLGTPVLCATRSHTMMITSTKLVQSPTMNDKDIDRTQTIISKAYIAKLTEVQNAAVTLTFKEGTRVFCATCPHTMVVISAKCFENHTMIDKDIDRTRTIISKLYTAKLTKFGGLL